MVRELLFVLFWILVVPIAVARTADTLINGKIFEWPRAYIEARFPGSMLEYLSGCPVCLSHWISMAFTVVFLPEWLALVEWTGRSVWYTIPVSVIFWLAATHLATIWVKFGYKNDG